MKLEFDYIIVGSGSAGAPLACRLSEDAGVSVLLLEAGPPDRHPLQVMPLAFLKVGQSRKGTWQFKTEPEPFLHGRQLDLPRGRTLGGTSSINAMIAIRGHRCDYDRWSAQGATGWSYEEVLPCFRRLETHWRGAGPFHGGDGPVRITRMQGPDMLWEPLRDAALDAGYPLCDDPNGAQQDGISQMESTTGDGMRSSTARAYLRPARHRPNLTILTGALAHRVVISHGRATGIEFSRNGRTLTAHAGREVILSGGTYNSPQLLLLSGIGPADELRAVGIEPELDLPGVGRNLIDHPNVLNEFELAGNLGLSRHLRLDRAVLQVGRWFLNHSGPFAYTGSAANLFVRSRSELVQPDLQLTYLPISNTAHLWTPLLQRAPTPRFTVRIGHLHPRSRGWVRLGSANPMDPPRIRTNFLEDPYDLDTLLHGLKLSRELFQHAPLRDLVRRETMPGAELAGDEALKDHIRRNVGHRAHPVGTCRMGVDDTAVVDPQLRVRGIQGLRVADASIMPDIIGGNTNLPSMMIGERAAELIRAAGR